MKNKWLITGVLSAGLAVTAVQAGMADEWAQNAAQDIAMGSGVVRVSTEGTEAVSGSGSKTAEAETASGSGRVEVGTKTSRTAGAEPNLETQITEVEPPASNLTGRGADYSTGSGVVAVKEHEQEAGPQGELVIDRTLGKNFIKQSFMECIGRSRSQVEEILGSSGEQEETEDYAAGKYDFHINYELGNNEDVRIDYKNDIAVRIFGTNVELLNFEKEEYSLSEIDAILGVEHVTLQGNTHFWHLQNKPDVTMELLDNYAFIYID